jgi:Putative phage tail protein
MGILRQPQSNGQIPYYTGLQIQTSGSNVPISMVWGANKIAPNCIWTGGFYGYYGYPENTSGGKGGLFSNNNSAAKSWQYYTSWAFALCEGPIDGLGTIWVGQSAKTPWGADIWTFFDGSQTQTPWAVWTNIQGFQGYALSYHGTAYITSFNYYLGSNATLPQFSMEVRGLLFNTSGINGGDADPAQIIQDFLTNSQYGVGFPAGSIDSSTLFSPASGPDSSYQGYCRASYIAMSPALTNQESANSILARWLKLTNSAAVWSGGKLKFIPYGDSVVGPTQNQLVAGGTVTFTPNVTPAYSLTDDDFIHEDGKDPVEVTRIDPFSLHNWLRLSINYRVAAFIPVTTTPNEPWTAWFNENSYVQAPVDVWDQNAIELYGLRMGPDITANEICDKKTAQIVAQTILQRQLYIRNHYKFKLSFEYCLLEPMDLVTITDASIGLNQVTVRIVDVEEDDNGLLDITAEEFPLGVATAAQYSVQGNEGNQVNQSVVPARVNSPIIFEPPASLTGGVANVFIAVSGGVAPVYSLTETPVSGQHYTGQSYAGGTLTLPVSPIVTTLSFTCSVQANARSAVRLNIYNGSAQVGADFDLIGIAAYPDSGVSASIVPAAVGSSWYTLTIDTPLAVTGTPAVYIYLETFSGGVFSNSYTGVSGNGIYIWGQGFSYAVSDDSASVPETFLPAFTMPVGATLATSGVAPPEGVSGAADINWGGANVWLSTDGSTYSIVGQALGQSRMGFLTASLGNSGGMPDTTDSLAVSLAESGGTLSSVTAIEASSGSSLCFISDSNSEFLSYQNATMTGANLYTLTTLYRGLEGTMPSTHASGVPFVRVDDSIFQYPLPISYIGVPIYIKLQSFNSFGLETEDLSECTAYTYTPTGAGVPLGPVSQTLALGQNMDFGLVTSAVTESDDWGLVSVPQNATIDLESGSSPP